MNRIEILTEEPSAEAALTLILRKISPDGFTFRIITHQGKQDLLAKLPAKLKAYKKAGLDKKYLIVLIDRDNDDCLTLKGRLERIARDAGLSTKSSPENAIFKVMNRIAIQELEAWFLGDHEAIKAAYPRVSGKACPNPDTVAKPSTYLTKILSRAGYKKLDGKIEMARKIATHMTPNKNKSESFRQLLAGIRACLQP
jgi:hypothetical protein